jgi:hypothetical protein
MVDPLQWNRDLLTGYLNTCLGVVWAMYSEQHTSIYHSIDALVPDGYADDTVDLLENENRAI